MSTIEKLTVEISTIEGKIRALSDKLNMARNAIVEAKADRDPVHPAYKAWKILDDRDSALRAELEGLRDELEDLLDE